MDAATLEFIHAHANDDVRQLALRRVPDGVNLREALTQIEGRQLAACKLPACAATGGFLFPPRLSLEQCSSEATASYKRRIAERLLASSLQEEGGGGAATSADLTTSFADLTGGLGIDFMAIAPLFKSATYVERNLELCELARHNLPLMGCPHAEVVCQEIEAESASFFTRCYTLLYIDPARRDASGRKVARIEDCTPDVCALQKQLRTHAGHVLIKLSPMLDLTAALRALDGIIEAHVISVEGECKELLLVMKGGNSPSTLRLEDIPIHCVNLTASPNQADKSTFVKSLFTFTLAEEQSTPQKYLLPSPLGEGSGVRSYLHEPNAGILKAGAFKTLCQRFPVQQLAPNSHLYAAETIVPDFPGRCWRIVDQATFNKKELKRLLQGLEAAELTVRGFPASVATLRKQLRLRDGGDAHFIATTLADNTKLLLKVLPV